MSKNNTSEMFPAESNVDAAKSHRPSESSNTSEAQITRDDINKSIREGIPSKIKQLSDEQLSERHASLANLPYLSSKVTDMLTFYSDMNYSIEMVNTADVVGSVSQPFKNWSTEYFARAGRAVSVAKKLIEGTPESIEYIFKLAQKDRGVKLIKISGPGGNLFIVRDGSHRVAGCKLAELDKLPARVEDASNPKKVHTLEPTLRDDWQDRIEAGLIKGTIESKGYNIPGENTTGFELNIEEQVVPWMTLPQGDLIRFSKFYEEHFPGSLSNLKNLKTGENVPLKAITDVVANNFYLGNRWEEYVKNNK